MIIEVAGIDGSGKSTLIAHLQGYLRDRDVPCLERVLRSTYKPVLTDIARSSDRSHWRDMFAVDEVELAHALEMSTLMATTILPLDHSQQVVVTDTYIRRWLATAHLWGVTNIDRLIRIYKRLPVPDLSFYLVVDADLAYRRLQHRPKRDHQVKLGSPERVRAYASSFAQTEALIWYPTRQLSTAASEDESLADMLAIVRDWISRWSLRTAAGVR